jgi:hypothetical protein
MNLQGKVGPIAVGAVIVLLAGLMFFLYRTTTGEQPHNVSPDNMPDYVKKGRATQPGAPGGSPYGAVPKTSAGGTQ